MRDYKARPFFSVFNVAIGGSVLLSGALSWGLLQLLLSSPHERVRIGLGSFVLLFAVIAFIFARCPRCLTSVIRFGRGAKNEASLRCTRCGLDFERNTYWTRPFTNPDRRKVQ